MKLEDYFDFLNENDIRIKGTRVGIETVIRDYKLGASPEEIVIRYPTLSLEQVYATITYYLANRAELDTYLERVTKEWERGWKEQEAHPSEFILELRKRLERQRKVLYERGILTNVVILFTNSQKRQFAPLVIT
jgi:uncharacterized protein (DUF433 family)